MIDELRTQINSWTTTDRVAIGMKALGDLGKDGVEIITLYDAAELVGIATINVNDNRLLNLATKRHGYGVAMLEKIAAYGIANGDIRSLSTDQSVYFYVKYGWVAEGYPGDNNGVPMYWMRSDMRRFMSDRADYLAGAAVVLNEYKSECEA